MTERTPSRQCGGWALLGLLLVLSGPPAYLLLIDQPFMRSTGAPGFALIVAGTLVGVTAARRDRRAWVRTLGGCAGPAILAPQDFAQNTGCYASYIVKSSESHLG